MDLDAVFDEFHDTIIEELDYQQEGRNAEQFQQLLAHRKDVVIPDIYWPYTTSQVRMIAALMGAVFLLAAAILWNEVQPAVSYGLGTLGLLLMLSQLRTGERRRDKRYARQINAMREHSRLEKTRYGARR
ncbi:hypothetical protein M2105_001143 [Paenibacillus sp. PastF-1]|nr:hypothetical protein [Paenibacillus sp. PastF-2]MDF9846349.1 hypothetical protein [Paenibacillus sp. PastM-2]MDF9853301.1 hypothetical protein [Paenibacillus sp. PastF-1]MDH6478195.1 hypothetical protein [Paenibacillus sp. PastH-2]MDH6506306.1 hypothetical protein [Paenibacillus sp. PastM-3]